MDRSNGTPEKQTLGAGENTGAGATPPKGMSGKTATLMDEDGATTRLELLSLKEEPLGLNRNNLRRVRKRKGAPRWVRKLTKMVELMIKDSTEEVPWGVVAQDIWGIVMELDRDGTRLLKDEAKNKKHCEKERRRRQRRRRRSGPRRSKSAGTTRTAKRQKWRCPTRQTILARLATFPTPPVLISRAIPRVTPAAHTTGRKGPGHGIVEAPMGPDGTMQPRRGRPEEFKF